MQCVLREKLMIQAAKLAKVSGIYQTESYRFVEAYIQWLDETQTELSCFRVPISNLIQAEKTSLISVVDGYVPEFIQRTKSVRKMQKAVAAQSLSKVSQEINVQVTKLDLIFEQMHEKISHAVAVLGSKEVTLYESIAEGKASEKMIWTALSTAPETAPMYNYISAKISATDRQYLLLNIIDFIKQNQVEQAFLDFNGTKVMTINEEENLNDKQPLKKILVSLLRVLKVLAIDTFESLLDKARTGKERRLLRKEKGVTKNDLLALVKCADLMRIDGMTLPVAYVLLLSGVNSAYQLKGRNTNNLLNKVNTLIVERKYEVEAVSFLDLEHWIDDSKQLPRAFLS